MLISETYPSGRKIQYAPTSANRVSQVNSVMNQAQTDYARQMTYAPSGAPASWNQGPAANSFTQEWKYNSRMQTTQLHASGASGTLLKLTLGYGEANNNGNLRDQTIETGVKTYRQNYSYDAANRLTNFEENILPSLLVTTRDTFQYDRFGNQWRTSILGLPPSAVGPASSSAYNAAKNQLVSGSYDAAGNQQLIGPNTAIYDAENKIVMHYLPTPDTWIEVKYDGEGKRVLRTVGGVQTRYVYDAFGDLAAEYTTGSVSGGTKYLVTDHLGSTRLVLDATGNCVQRSDYLPFGFEQWRTTGDHPCYGGNPPVPQSTTLRFTGKERDSDTGLDYFSARYMSGTIGRFTSPDEPLAFADVVNPQSWNLYSYGYNNPMLYSDPDGHEPCENGVNPESGNLCVVATASKSKVEANSSPIGPLILPLLTTTVQVAQKTQELVQPVADWFSRPRNPICTAGYTALGASIGFWAGGGVGTLGLAGGPAAAATIPGGAAGGTALGGAIGGFGGLVLCSTGSGTGGGGGAASQSNSSEFWKGLKPFRGKTKTNGLQGKDKRFFEWDHTHGDVEVYDGRGRHLGSADPNTGTMTKPAVPGRSITI